MMNARNIFNEFERQEIVATIQEVELKTSCEIRVHIEEKSEIPLQARAQEIFDFLEMHQTKLRNGVLLYINLLPLDFYIHFDKGILEHPSYSINLNEITQVLSEKINQRQLVAGIKDTLSALGVHLSTPYPYNSDDINELPNEISFG